MSSYNMHSMTKQTQDKTQDVNVAVPQEVLEQHKALAEQADTLLDESKSYQQAGDSDKAWECLERALEVYPTYWRALLSKSIMLENMGKLEESFAAVQQAYQANPNHHLTNYNFARMYLMGSEDYPEIIKLVHKALEIKPDFFLALVLLAQIQVADNQLEQGIQTIQQALELEPNDAHALTNYAEYLLMQGDVDSAREILSPLAQSYPRAKSVLEGI